MRGGSNVLFDKHHSIRAEGKAQKKKKSQAHLNPRKRDYTEYLKPLKFIYETCPNVMELEMGTLGGHWALRAD